MISARLRLLPFHHENLLPQVWCPLSIITSFPLRIPIAFSFLPMLIPQRPNPTRRTPAEEICDNPSIQEGNSSDPCYDFCRCKPCRTPRCSHPVDNIFREQDLSPPSRFAHQPRRPFLLIMNASESKKNKGGAAWPARRVIEPE